MKKTQVLALLLSLQNLWLFAQNATIYSDDFETPQTWTIFEEIVSGNACYSGNIGEVAPTTEAFHGGTKALRVWSNKNGAMKSNHVIAAHHISNSNGITGRLKYGMWVNNATTLGLTQSGPEFSVQSTRTVGSQNLTYIAGIQYIGNQWVTDKWNIWHNGTWQTIKLAEFGTTLVANTWYYLELEFDMTTNQYIAFRIEGGGLNLNLNLTQAFQNAPLGFKIGAEARNWTPSLFVTAESENLWTGCSEMREDKVFYDDIALQSVTTVLPVELVNFSGNTEGSCGGLNNAINASCKHILNWETASEINTNTFELQQLIGDNLFKTITTIKANNKAFNYSFINNSPLINTNYYRLKINDFDGKTTFSKTISLENNKLIKQLTIYPNPVNDVLFIENSAGKNVEIINVLGQIVLSFSPTNKQFPITINELKSGVYFIKTADEMVRFIKN